MPRLFTLPLADKFGLENARKAFAKASGISRHVTTLAAGNLFTLETDEHVIVDSGGEKCIPVDSSERRVTGSWLVQIKMNGVASGLALLLDLFRSTRGDADIDIVRMTIQFQKN